MIFNNISFILHKPQLSENIGLCARGMKNFGFKKLSIIDPKPLFPNDKIIATSVGAKDVIEKAKIYSNLERSIKKTDILIATSARFRNKNIKHISLKDLKKLNFKKQYNEYKKNNFILKKLLKIKKIKSMSHPCGSYNSNTLKILKTLNIDIGFKQIMNNKETNSSKYEICRQDHSNIIRSLER